MTATLLEVMAETARRCAAGFDSTCTAAGTTTTLVDAVAADEGVSTTFAQGGWILRPDAPTADDQVRRISLFDPATGTFTVSRAWADAPDDAEAYYVFAILPPLALPGIPESWQRLVNRGLAATWYDAAIPVAAGDGTLNRFPLAAEDGWVPNDQQVKMVLFRTYLDNGNVRDLPLNTGGRKWRLEPGDGQTMLVTNRSPRSDETVIVIAVRTYSALDAITDETACDLTIASLRARYELYTYLDAAPQTKGQYAGEAKAAYQDWWSQYRTVRPAGAVVIV